MANFITILRIVFSIVLLFLTPLSPAFYALYIAAGITDMTDGTVARLTGTASENGAKLDTAADIVFAAVCLAKLLPVLEIPVSIYVWTAAVALTKAASITAGYIRNRQFTAVHTVLNKVAGAMLFALPLTLTFISLKYSAFAVCAVASAAAVQELYCVIKCS